MKTSAILTTTTTTTAEVPSTSKSVAASSTGKVSSQITKAPSNKPNKTVDAVSGTSIEHPKDETLKPLMIGLGVGIVAGLITIGVIAWICVRRKRFYTSRYEDELKPITKAGSTGSLNNGIYYHDEYHDNDEELELESES